MQCVCVEFSDVCVHTTCRRNFVCKSQVNYESGPSAGVVPFQPSAAFCCKLLSLCEFFYVSENSLFFSVSRRCIALFFVQKNRHAFVPCVLDLECSQYICLQVEEGELTFGK